jgi:hypothetical protein
MILGIIAVVCGVLALSQINAQPGVLGGKTQAGWGIALGLVGVLFWLSLLS